MAELRKRRTSLNRAVVVNQDADFEELFKDLEEVREAVARELKEINGHSVSLFRRANHRNFL